MNQSDVLENRELNWYFEDEADLLESKVANLESLAGSPGIFKIGDSTESSGSGCIEKVPKEIKARSAPDPFQFSRMRPAGSISIKSAFD